MAVRSLQLHVFASAKGGVGKTTLALACAKLAAAEGRRVALLDLDMTGSAISDGLRILAPDLPVDSDGHLSLATTPRDRWLSREETVRRRWRRLARPGTRRWLPFLNDAFAPDGAPDCSDLDTHALRWRADPEDGIGYWPSSALLPDVQDAVNFQFYQDAIAWPARLSWFIWRLVEQDPDLDTLIFDLPPGLFGFGYTGLSMAAKLARPSAVPKEYGFSPIIEAGFSWSVHPWLVCSPDHNDLLSALSCPMLYNGALPELTALVNRCATPSLTSHWVKTEFPSSLGVSMRMRFVEPEPMFLGQLFQREDMDLGSLIQAKPALVKALRGLYGLTGGAV